MNQNIDNQLHAFAWRPWLAFFAFVAIAGYFVLSEHRVHALAILPWALIFLACPLLHVFMHHGHGGHSDHSSAESGGAALEPGRERALPPADTSNHRH